MTPYSLTVELLTVNTPASQFQIVIWDCEAALPTTATATATATAIV
jgi:hypothetical protein